MRLAIRRRDRGGHPGETGKDVKPGRDARDRDRPPPSVVIAIPPLRLCGRGGDPVRGGHRCAGRRCSAAAAGPTPRCHTRPYTVRVLGERGRHIGQGPYRMPRLSRVAFRERGNSRRSRLPWTGATTTARASAVTSTRRRRGEYVFWISSDDNSELWLSTDEKPEGKVKVAEVTAWTGPREWTREPGQQSKPIRLEGREGVLYRGAAQGRRRQRQPRRRLAPARRQGGKADTRLAALGAKSPAHAAAQGHEAERAAPARSRSSQDVGGDTGPGPDDQAALPRLPAP
jgi:hypothetical protein